MVPLVVTADQRYDCITNAFQVDACRTTKCFGDYIDNCVKMVHLSPLLMKGVGGRLYDKHTGKRLSRLKVAAPRYDLSRSPIVRSAPKLYISTAHSGFFVDY
ncbi:hypothetical protein TNCV_1956101 [Trichonephila clavipes]|nr:hypothetical protein TNCV_1956101 [Trichonephila clavipes]